MDPNEEVPGRLAAYFLIPLPEPIGIPAGLPMRFGEGPNHNEVSQRDRVKAGFRGRFTSAIVHHIKQDSAAGIGLDPLFVLAKEVLPWAIEDSGNEVDAERAVDDVEDDSTPLPDLTVVEIACLINEENDPEEELTEAFDYCLEVIRDIQRGYLLVRHHPLTLCTRESLPFAVPYAVGRVDGSGHPTRVMSLSLFMLHTNMWSYVREPDMSDEELTTFRFALTHIGDDRAFLTFLECKREARVAGNRRGDYRTAAILAATAAEALFDDLLLQLMWEESVRPEEAAEVFIRSRHSVASRVSAEYAGRLGGLWDASRPGPIADWANKVARLRHRAVHGGYIPDLNEIRASEEALDGLEQFIASRLTDPRRLSQYPRTAMALLGEPGLTRRGLWRGKVRRVAEDPTEPNWGLLFRRWKETVERVRLESQAASPEVPPTQGESVVVLVVQPSGTRVWILHDRNLHKAALIDEPDLTDFMKGQASLDVLLQEIDEAGLDEPVAIQIDVPVDHVVVCGEWLHEYRMLPDGRVLLDGRDLD